MASRIVVLNQGVIEQVGSPLELYRNPDNLFVAGFLGAPKMNLLQGTLAAASSTVTEVTLPGVGCVRVAADATRSTPGGAVTLGIRPEHLQLSAGHDGSADNTLAARVDLIEYLGDHLLAYTSIAGIKDGLCAKLAGHATPLRTGDAARVHLPPAQCLLFDAAGAAYPRIQ